MLMTVWEDFNLSFSPVLTYQNYRSILLLCKGRKYGYTLKFEANDLYFSNSWLTRVESPAMMVCNDIVIVAFCFPELPGRDGICLIFNRNLNKVEGLWQDDFPMK